MFCNNCGCEVQEGSKFCGNCGELVVQEKNNSDDNVTSDLTDENNVIASESTESNDVAMSDKVKDFVKAGVAKFKASPNRVEYSIIAGFVGILFLWLIIVVATNTANLTGKWENSQVGYILFTDDGDFFIDNDNIHGTYSTKGTQLILIENDGSIVTLSYDISGNILTITEENGDKMALFKAE